MTGSLSLWSLSNRQLSPRPLLCDAAAWWRWRGRRHSARQGMSRSEKWRRGVSSNVALHTWVCRRLLFFCV